MSDLAWKILIIEDDKGLNNLICKALAREGYLTESALNGKEGIRIITGYPEPMLVLLDYLLPDMNGKEFVASMIGHGCAAPFIVMTGQGDERVAVEMMKLGARDYLVKDSDILELLPGIISNAIREVEMGKKLRLIENELQISEEKHRLLFDTMAEGVVYHNADGKLISANAASEKILGMPQDEMSDIESLIRNTRPVFEDNKEIAGEVFPTIVSLKTGTPVSDVVMGIYNARDENYRWVVVNSVPQSYPGEENPYLVFTTFTDITDHVNAEEKIRKSLKEKEILLKEIHHRVKNNLQVVSSLLSLQADYIIEEKDKELFFDSQRRVRSMAMIHEKLYRSDSLSELNFHEHISDLMDELMNSYSVSSGKIAIIIDVEDLPVDIDVAIPSSLIINELVSNSLKYAFPDDLQGEVMISFYKNNDDYILKVSDNGVGLPPGVDFRNTESLGLMLVNALTKQLRGSIELNNDNGAYYDIRFPMHPGIGVNEQ